jgi:fructokinase
VLVIGEALVDLIQRPGEQPVASVGGSPLNVAVGLSRLDVPAVLWTDIGADPYGELVRDRLAADGVVLGDAARADRPTSTALATIGADGAARYDFSVVWDLGDAPPPLSAPPLVHTGSIGAVLEPGADRVRSVIEALRPVATVSYDPNVRPQLMGEVDRARARIEALVERADVVKASDEDLAWLYPDADPRDVAEQWRSLGPAFVVVTQGEGGSYAVCADGPVEAPARPTQVADTIGAGDSFMAGLLAALADRDLLGRAHADRLRAVSSADLAGILGFAAACAAVTVGRPGAEPPRRGHLQPV